MFFHFKSTINEQKESAKKGSEKNKMSFLNLFSTVVFEHLKFDIFLTQPAKLSPRTKGTVIFNLVKTSMRIYHHELTSNVVVGTNFLLILN